MRFNFKTLQRVLQGYGYTIKGQVNPGYMYVVYEGKTVLYRARTLRKVYNWIESQREKGTEVSSNLKPYSYAVYNGIGKFYN